MNCNFSTPAHKQETTNIIMSKAVSAISLFFFFLAAIVSDRAYADPCCLCAECQPVEYDLADKALIDVATGVITTCDALQLSLLLLEKDYDDDQQAAECEAAQTLFREPCCAPHDDDKLEYVQEEERRSLWKSVTPSFGGSSYRSFSAQNNAAWQPSRFSSSGAFGKPAAASKKKKNQPAAATFSSSSSAGSFGKPWPAATTTFTTSSFRSNNNNAAAGVSASARGCARICPAHQMKYYCRGVHLNPFAAQKDLPIINTSCENVHAALARANGAVCDMAAATIPATCGCPGASNNFAQFFGAVNTKDCGGGGWVAH